jgi:DNA-binding response OmpR family regulator
MSSTANKTILLVDDDQHLLVTLTDFLTFEGFQVVQATSGEKALELVEERVPDLMILDISMPGIGGLGFLRRATEKAPELPCPVLVLTARSKMEQFFDTLDVDGFLAKPCSQEDLLRKIEAIFSEREARDRKKRNAARRILLGEDEPWMVAALEERLLGKSYEMETAGRGPEVLERATLRRPDVIVLREELRGMRGTTVAALLDDMDSTRGIPVVLYRKPQLEEPADRRYRYAPPRGAQVALETRDPDVLVRSIGEVLES